MSTPEQQLHAAAREAGFDWCGVAGAEALREEEAHLRVWLTDGMHGTMRWLEKEPERRADPGRVLERCRSVIVLGLNYQRPNEPEGPPPPGLGRVSRYARTRDYHRVIENAGRKLCRALREQIAPGCEARLLVDYGPALERAWALRAGLGFIGKNTMLIHPQEGSWHFLAVILTDAVLAPTAPDPAMSGCGNCRKCLDVCPTGALVEPGRLDARRCISYLTIEHDGPFDTAFVPQLEGWVFGCDLCQEVCPYNRARSQPRAEDGPLGPEFVPAHVSLTDWLRLRDADLAAMTVATPLRRAGADRLARNAAAVVAHRGTDKEREELRTLTNDSTRPEWLRQWARELLGKSE